MRRRHLMIAGLVLVTSVVLMHNLVRRDAALAVQTAAVTSGPIIREVLSTGTFQPARAVDVGAAVSGTLQSLEADFNTPVRRGQVVARIDPSLYRTQLIEAQAKLGQAQSELARRKLLVEDARAKLE